MQPFRKLKQYHYFLALSLLVVHPAYAMVPVFFPPSPTPNWDIAYTMGGISVTEGNSLTIAPDATDTFPFAFRPVTGALYRGSLHHAQLVASHDLSASPSSQIEPPLPPGHYFVAIYENYDAGYYVHNCVVNPLTCIPIPTAADAALWFASSTLPNTSFAPPNWGMVNFTVMGTTTPSIGERAASLAKELVNSTYLFGGKGWDYNNSEFVATGTIKSGYHFWDQAIKSVASGIGVDCSGLIMWAYNRSFDPMKSRFKNFVKAESADTQFRYNSTSTTESALQLGDVLFFDNVPKDGHMDHVAMYVGESGGYDVVSASNPRDGIVSRTKNLLKNTLSFTAFKRITSALPPSVLATAHSPVDLTLTDPDGLTITPTTTLPSEEEYLREIPGELYYSEMERGMDGKPIDQIYSYVAKTGDYLIKVLPEQGTSPAATYSLNFSVMGSTTVLAAHVPISQIPIDGYGVTVNHNHITTTYIPISIDIKSGNATNVINCKNENKEIRVAILSTATFNVATVAVDTVRFGPAGAKEAHHNKNRGKAEHQLKDINHDGKPDLVLHFRFGDTGLTCSDTQGTLVGQTTSGVTIKGINTIWMVGKKEYNNDGKDSHENINKDVGGAGNSKSP